MFNQRFKIIVSLIVAFFVVSAYGKLSSTPFITPIQADNIKGLLTNIKFPKLNLTKLFSLQINPNSIDNQPSITNNSPNSFSLPSLPPQPTKSSHFQPTLAPTNQPYITDSVILEPSQKPTPTIFLQSFPTYTPKPTKTPKPTATPKPAAITSSQRPGSTLTEILNEVQNRECVPAALLYAFQTQETGPWWPVNTPSSKVKIYNKYGWWLDGTGNSCTGMGYHTQTGIVPEDAVDAGTSCQNPIPSGADQAIMGLWQISKYEEDAAKKYMTGVIKGNIDRRVIFDNAIIFAIITKKRLGSPPKSCTDWPEDAIRTVAEKHYGSCGDNYCANILNYYRKYKKS